MLVKNLLSVNMYLRKWSCGAVHFQLERGRFFLFNVSVILNFHRFDGVHLSLIPNYIILDLLIN